MNILNLEKQNHPYILNPVNINIYLKQMKNEDYLLFFNFHNIFQDVLKSIINNSNKNDQINTLNDKLNMIIKGENIYLKPFSFVSINIINRYYFIIGIKKIFKEKNIKELSGNDFIQFCLLLTNDFNRNLLEDILILYNYENGNIKNKFDSNIIKDTLINYTYNYKMILDIFSNYFLFYDLILQINKIYNIEEENDSNINLNIEEFINKLIVKIENKEIHEYYIHLIYKCLLILSKNKTENKKNIIIFKLEYFNEFKEFKINYYSFIWLLLVKINETKNLFEEFEKSIKKKSENFNNFVDYLINEQSEGDED